MLAPQAQQSDGIANKPALDDIRHELERLKAKLKDWETRFNLKYNRQPTKDDVTLAPQVEQAYRRYAKLKRLIQTEKQGPLTHAVKREHPTVTPRNDRRAVDMGPIVSAASPLQSPPGKRKRFMPAPEGTGPANGTIDDEPDDDQVIDPTPVKRVRGMFVTSRLQDSGYDNHGATCHTNINNVNVPRAIEDSDQQHSSVFSRALNKLHGAVQHRTERKDEPSEGDGDAEEHTQLTAQSYIERLLQIQGIKRRPVDTSVSNKNSAETLPQTRSGSSFGTYAKSSLLRSKTWAAEEKYSHGAVIAPSSLLHGAFRRFSNFSTGNKIPKPHLDSSDEGFIAERIADEESFVQKPPQDMKNDGSINDEAELGVDHAAGSGQEEDKHHDQGICVENGGNLYDSDGELDSGLSSVEDDQEHDETKPQEEEHKVVEESVISKSRRKRSAKKIAGSGGEECEKRHNTTKSKPSQSGEKASKQPTTAKSKSQVVPPKFARFNTRTRGRNGSRGSRGFGRNGFRRTGSTSFAHHTEKRYDLQDEDLDDYDMPVASAPIRMSTTLPELAIVASDGEEGDEICTIARKYLEDANGGPVRVNLRRALQSLTGHDVFRSGQLQATKSVLEGKSTMLILPTGTGKSLCYQLPAYVLKRLHQSKQVIRGFTLVVVPTVSLAQDQLRRLPWALSGETLSGLSTKLTLDSMSKLFEEGGGSVVDVLFVNPERLHTPFWTRLMQSHTLPSLWLTCIDEVHCLSEWSHNFRESYLYLKKIVMTDMNSHCILGLTATATVLIRKKVCRMLDIPEENCIVTDRVLPDNLRLTATRVAESDDRNALLLTLLRTPMFAKMNSIIIYVMYQNQADRLSQYLRVRSLSVDAYHAGLAESIRTHVQRRFMTGELRIVVATVAFGLGLDKSDVRGIIHFSLPRSMEHYVQECGRAGRDGLESICHAFVSKEEYVRLRSFAYSEGIDQPTIWRFLKKALPDKVDGRAFGGKEKSVNIHALDIAEMERLFDVKESVLKTILSYIELEPNSPIKIAPDTPARFIIKFGSDNLAEMADNDDVLEAMLKLNAKVANQLNVDTLKMCRLGNISPSDLQSKLWHYQKKKVLTFESEAPSFCLEIKDHWFGFAQDERDSAVEQWRDNLAKSTRNIEVSKVLKIDSLYQLLHQSSTTTLYEHSAFYNLVTSLRDDALDAERETALRSSISAYFMDEKKLLMPGPIKDPDLAERAKTQKKAMEFEVRIFVNQHSELLTTGRCVARIMHGLGSPRFPATEWSRTKQWNAFAFIPFMDIATHAQSEIASVRTRRSTEY
ncbi:hypothetical protein SeMB42_g04348 [Synchytrium endobioticum]|uniref:DNA 3'-5' helicase n=1 Tax=Synchytrium endobioticum TaxID=286115 RepID=A0A507CZ91_9FUNG|nr:hypothetical protein SeMB42_g04348 [Synchytrium endobioticum]TPX49218.1 hypothetical protein SeLEV6574_g01618 [Synchytrium endobioticum]